MPNDYTRKASGRANGEQLRGRIQAKISKMVRANYESQVGSPYTWVESGHLLWCAWLKNEGADCNCGKEGTGAENWGQ